MGVTRMQDGYKTCLTRSKTCAEADTFKKAKCHKNGAKSDVSFFDSFFWGCSFELWLWGFFTYRRGAKVYILSLTNTTEPTTNNF